MALIFTLLEKILVLLCKIAVLVRLILTISLVGKAKQPWNNLIPTIHLHRLKLKCINLAMISLNRILQNGKPSWQRSKKLAFLICNFII